MNGRFQLVSPQFISPSVRWRAIVAFLLLANASAFSQNEKTPEEVAEIVCDRIKQEAHFQLAPKVPPAKQSFLYHFDYRNNPDWIGNFSVVQSKIVFDPEKIKEGEEYFLGVSHSPGELVVILNGEQIQLKNEDGIQLEQLDYELIRLEHYLPLNPYLAAGKNTIELRILMMPTGHEAKFYVGFQEGEDKLSTRSINLQNPYRSELEQVFTASILEDTGADHLPYPTPYLPSVPMTQNFTDRFSFSDWRYYTGTFLVAMDEVSTKFESLDNSAHLTQHFDFFFKHEENIAAERRQTGQLGGPFSLYYRFKMLDDLGPQGAALLHYLENKHNGNLEAIKSDRHFPLVQRIEKAITRGIDRLPDGTFVRITPDSFTVQSDDLFMAGLFLIEAGKILDRPDLIEEAVTQTLNFHRYLYDPEWQLYHHAYFTWKKEQACCIWGRGMGWMMMIYAELLELLPTDHPKWVELLQNFQNVCDGLRKTQSADGRWHQIITDSTTYLETSATAMFVRAFAAGVVNGWLPEKEFRGAALLGWKSLSSQVTKEGIEGIVRGTPIFMSAEEYANHKVRQNDPRGLGAILWAAMAVEKL